VLLDVGNVLIQLNPLERLVSGMASSSSIRSEDFSPRDPLELLRNDPITARLELGQASDGEFFDAVRRAYGLEIPDEEIRWVYNRILGESMPGMAGLIGELRSRGVRVMGLTNTSHSHLGLLRAYPEVEALEDVIASCVIQYRKPEPEIYRVALERIGTEAAETLFVDDQQDNVDGAKKVGLQAVVFRDAAALRALLGLK